MNLLVKSAAVGCINASIADGFFIEKSSSRVFSVWNGEEIIINGKEFKMEIPLVCTRPEGLGDSIVHVDRLIRVIDGDSFVCCVHRWPALLGKNITIRIAGVDCPEMRSKDTDVFRKAFQAKRNLEKHLTGCRDITLFQPKRGKYFRVVADVMAGGVDLRKQIIENGFGIERK